MFYGFPEEYVYTADPHITMWSSGYLCGSLRGVMAKALAYRIVVREFELWSRYLVHFCINTIGKGMKPHILPAVG